MTAGISKPSEGRRLWSLKGVPDGELVEALHRLVSDSRRVEALVVAHLAEVDARKLHLRAGYSSLFAYCQKALGLSEMEAFYRITAARLARRYPLIFEMLEQGHVHLSGICVIRRHLTTENHAEILREIRNKSKRQIEELVARRFPRADVAERLRRLQRVEPLSEERYLLQVTISKDLKEKLELARDLMSHANPSGDLAVVLERAIEPLVERLSARRFGLTPTPRSAAVSNPSAGQGAPRESKRKHIPNRVRREVALRDGLRCTYMGDDGTRCEARAFLQLDHELGWAKGGKDESENLAVLCAAHNLLRAEQEHGVTHIEEAIERGRQPQHQP